MPFDREPPRRLHPSAVLFNLAGQLKAFGVPALLLIVGARSPDDAWRLWGALLIVPAAIGAFARYFAFTYRYGTDELIVRSGIFFKRERHIPYSRIQNIDATQNIVHALFGVHAVALETASGSEAEATLPALPESALDEMRRRVFEGRGTAAGDAAVDETPREETSEVLLQLGLRDLALCGLVRGRGLLLLGALLGLALEMGITDDAVVETAGEAPSRGPVVRAVRQMAAGLSFNLAEVIAAAAVLTLLLVALRMLSVIYTMQRLYGFTLALASGELRLTYGSLTRVKATIPLRRIQTLTIRAGPLHRMFGVCAVRADTAGGEANKNAAGSREWLAPIIPRAGVQAFVRRLMPEADLGGADWQPPHPRALRRALVKPLVFALAASVAAVWHAGAWALPIAVVFAAAAVRHARLRVASMRHAVGSGVVMFRSGWFWRHVTVAPLRKVQAVAMRESPFDRRHGMAGLAVDTAGASGSPHRLDVPYLARERAAALSATIADAAAESALSW